MVALDKAFPRIPSVSEYRPIVITSPIIKALEAYLLPDLQTYGIIRLNKNQVGFVANRSTADNVVRLYLECQKHKNEGYVIFVDFSSAYDTIQRKKLYEILHTKRILNESKIQILKFVHQNLRIKLGNKDCNIERGVPQGCTTSPMLFNIYTEELLELLEE